MQRDFLTNEKLKALFKSNFDLANYAIRLARYKILSGHEVNVDDLLGEVLAQPYRYTTVELEQLGEQAKEKTEERQAHTQTHRS